MRHLLLAMAKDLGYVDSAAYLQDYAEELLHYWITY